MTERNLLDLLDLPPAAQVNQRVPKKLLLEQGAPTAADKRLIQTSVEDATWLAALKPSTIGVAAYRDELREYLEIAILSVDFRPEAKSARLTELIHRAIPYPLILFGLQAGVLTMSLAHKRWSQAESQAVVLDGDVVSVALPTLAPSPIEGAFVTSLSLTAQKPADLLALYQGWIDRVEALLAAQLTGAFSVPLTADYARSRRAALQEYGKLQAEIRDLRAQAGREKQLRDLVDLNLAIAERQRRLTATAKRL